MDLRIVDIRRRVAREGAATPEDVNAVDDLLEAEGPTVELLVLRGQLIQLVTDAGDDALDEAFASYREALELDPDSATANEEIAHYLDNVADDPAEAIPFFRRAIELGAGETAHEGLREALLQVGDLEP